MPIHRDEYEKVPYFECAFYTSFDGGNTFYHDSEIDHRTGEIKPADDVAKDTLDKTNKLLQICKEIGKEYRKED